MDQATFSELEHDSKKRRTRREEFLARMDELIPWERLAQRVEPFYPKAGRGRRPYRLATMLRVHCVQLFYNLSDPGIAEVSRFTYRILHFGCSTVRPQRRLAGWDGRLFGARLVEPPPLARLHRHVPVDLRDGGATRFSGRFSTPW